MPGGPSPLSTAQPAQPITTPLPIINR